MSVDGAVAAEWQTAVSVVLQDNKVLIRGYSHDELIDGTAHSDAVFLTLRGQLPSESEARMFNALMNSLLDHGFVASSVVAARYIASGNPSLIAAVAGGLLAAGSNTINPRDAMNFVRAAAERRRVLGMDIGQAASVIAEEVRAEHRRIPGLGHPTHRGYDFRARRLRAVAVECGFYDPATQLYEAIHKAFVDRTKRSDLPINVDGMIACVMNAMGFEPMEATAVAVLAVLPGLMAQVIEEIAHGPRLRHIAPSRSVYTGPAERQLPSLGTLVREGDSGT